MTTGHTIQDLSKVYYLDPRKRSGTPSDSIQLIYTPVYRCTYSFSISPACRLAKKATDSIGWRSYLSIIVPVLRCGNFCRKITTHESDLWMSLSELRNQNQRWQLLDGPNSCNQGCLAWGHNAWRLSCHEGRLAHQNTDRKEWVEL